DISAGRRLTDEIGPTGLCVLHPLEEFLVPLPRLRVAIVQDVASLVNNSANAEFAMADPLRDTCIHLHDMRPKMLLKQYANTPAVTGTINRESSFDMLLEQQN